MPKYKNLDSRTAIVHQTPDSNWKPKNSKTEWWYAAGKLTDENNNIYFYQFTVFHTVRLGAQLYITHVAISDYQSKEHLFEEKIYFPHKKHNFTEDIIHLGKNIISLKNNQIVINVNSKNIKFNLVSKSIKPAVWHGNNGIISMGNPEKSNKNSFYYSFTNMNTTGSISFTNKNGESINLIVEGNTWFDRQWGEFAKETWNWFSLKFNDGEEVMLYGFPDTDYKTATYITKDGSAIQFNDFNYLPNKSIKIKKILIGHEWYIKIPIKEQEYILEPLCENDVNPNIVHNYWEGLCKILNSKGELKGWAVIEVTK